MKTGLQFSGKLLLKPFRLGVFSLRTGLSRQFLKCRGESQPATRLVGITTLFLCCCHRCREEAPSVPLPCYLLSPLCYLAPYLSRPVRSPLQFTIEWKLANGSRSPPSGKINGVLEDSEEVPLFGHHRRISIPKWNFIVWLSRFPVDGTEQKPGRLGSSRSNNRG